MVKVLQLNLLNLKNFLTPKFTLFLVKLNLTGSLIPQGVRAGFVDLKRKLMLGLHPNHHFILLIYSDFLNLPFHFLANALYKSDHKTCDFLLCC